MYLRFFVEYEGSKLVESRTKALGIGFRHFVDNIDPANGPCVHYRPSESHLDCLVEAGDEESIIRLANQIFSGVEDKVRVERT